MPTFSLPTPIKIAHSTSHFESIIRKKKPSEHCLYFDSMIWALIWSRTKQHSKWPLSFLCWGSDEADIKFRWWSTCYSTHLPGKPKISREKNTTIYSTHLLGKPKISWKIKHHHLQYPLAGEAQNLMENKAPPSTVPTCRGSPKSCGK